MVCELNVLLVCLGSEHVAPFCPDDFNVLLLPKLAGEVPRTFDVGCSRFIFVQPPTTTTLPMQRLTVSHRIHR